MTLLAALLVMAAAVIALEGLGSLAIAGVARLAGARPPWDRPGVRGAVGVAVLAFVAGIAAPAGIPMLVPLLVLAATGIAGFAALAWRRRGELGDRRVLAIRLGVLVVLGAWLTVWTLAHPLWNVCDDDVAYLPLSDALLHGEGLDQPFSQRRIGTLGAFLPLHLVGSIPFGPYAAQLGDAIVCPLLTAAAMLWSGRGRAGLALGVAGAAVAALGAVGRINLGPSGLTVLLLVGLGLIALRATELDGRPRLAAAATAGALAATLIACRLHYAPVALVPVAIVALAGPRGARLRRAAAAAAGGLIAVAGWMIAGWQASGTPLFPVLGSGTINPDWQGYDDPLVHRPGVLWGRTLDLLAYSDTWFILVAAGTVALVMVLHRRDTVAFAVPLAMTAVAAALIVVFPALITTSAPEDSWRLTRPLVVAALLVLVAALARTVDRERPGWPISMATAAGLFLVLGLGQVPWTAVIADGRGLGEGITAANDFDTDPDAPTRADYEAVVRDLPGDASVVYAVDRPALMRRAGARAYNLDVVGANSPGPGMPFFRGAEAKVAYLRDQGISYVVSVDPGASACLYRRDTWQANLTGPERVYQLWAPWFLDWFHDADLIAQRPGTRHVGALRVTPLT